MRYLATLDIGPNKALGAWPAPAVGCLHVEWLAASALALISASICSHPPWCFSAAGIPTFCREEEERGNAMKALENRTLDSKREMDIMNALDEMQSLNARHERVDTEAALAALRRSAVEDEDVSQSWGEECCKRSTVWSAGDP